LVGFGEERGVRMFIFGLILGCAVFGMIVGAIVTSVDKYCTVPCESGNEDLDSY